MRGILNPANLLTLSRVPLAIAFLLVFRTDCQAALWASLGIVVVIELTDLFDGMLARALGCVSDFGKLVDPFCDSFSRLTVFMVLSTWHLVPLWMTAVLLLRDLTVSFVRTVASAQGVVIGARWSGKVKAFVQGPVAIAIVALVAVAPETARELGPWLMLAASVVTAWSLVDYVWGSREVLAKA